MSSATERLGRVITLDDDVFAELAADTHATGQAILVVIGVALAQGVGESVDVGLFSGVAEACGIWMLWTLAIHGCARAIGLSGDLGALFRALGFAAAPLALGAFQMIPWLGPFFWCAKWVLGIGAFVLAVRRVLAVETGQAIALSVLGLAIAVVLTLPIGWLRPG